LTGAKPELDSAHLRECLRFAGRDGNLDILRWLVERFSPTEEQFKNSSVIEWACAAGHRNVLEWLLDYRGPQAMADARTRQGMLSRACIAGQLEVAQWLANRLGITPAEVRAGDNDTFFCACLGFKLEVLKWLVDQFQLTAADARSRNSEALAILCRDQYRGIYPKKKSDAAASMMHFILAPPPQGMGATPPQHIAEKIWADALIDAVSEHGHVSFALVDAIRDGCGLSVAWTEANMPWSAAARQQVRQRDRQRQTPA
jgi:hypothetical protein